MPAKWEKPSEIVHEGQYLLAHKDSDYLTIISTYTTFDARKGYTLYEATGKAWTVESPTLAQKYNDDDWRLFGPVRAPMFL